MNYGEMGRLTDEAIGQSMRLAETTALLTVAVQYAWLDAWAWGYRQAGSVFDEPIMHQTRTVRLIRRGVSPAAAMRRLRVV